MIPFYWRRKDLRSGDIDTREERSHPRSGSLASCWAMQHWESSPRSISPLSAISVAVGIIPQHTTTTTTTYAHAFPYFGDHDKAQARDRLAKWLPARQKLPYFCREEGRNSRGLISIFQIESNFMSLWCPVASQEKLYHYSQQSSFSWTRSAQS